MIVNRSSKRETFSLTYTTHLIWVYIYINYLLEKPIPVEIVDLKDGILKLENKDLYGELRTIICTIATVTFTFMAETDISTSHNRSLDTSAVKTSNSETLYTFGVWILFLILIVEYSAYDCYIHVRSWRQRL